MDSLTHIAIGACMGEAFAGKRAGKRALKWGILTQSIPDIDFLASLWLSPSDNLMAHRGFTHSILFVLLISPVFAFLADRFDRHPEITFRNWLYFFLLASGLHIFLDAFNSYGVGWFEPFVHTRISFHTIYVADPFFSIAPGIAALLLLITRAKYRFRSVAWKAGLGICFLYTAYCSVNKLIIQTRVKRALEVQQIPHEKWMTTPAPLQNWLWFVVAGNDSGFYTGYVSVFDKTRELALTYHPKNINLLVAAPDQRVVARLVQFSQGFYTVEKNRDTLAFNDLRFGQTAGWYNAYAPFAFSYYLAPPADNRLVVQRGRFTGWTSSSFRAFVDRIRGR